MDIWTAFLIGFIGSFHCVGMCGAIALSLPYQGITRFATVLNGLVYNLGRVSSYSLIGAILGALGQGVLLAGMQQFLSIAVGVLLLLAAFSIINFEKELVALPFLSRWYLNIRTQLSRLIKSHSPRKQSLYLVGVMNGFLPCGLVYLAIVGAISVGSVLGGSLYMAVFGLGTVPMMVLVAILGNIFSLNFRKYIQKVTPFLLFVFAILFILRCLNLDIPYISPQLIQDNSNLNTPPICH